MNKIIGGLLAIAGLMTYSRANKSASRRQKPRMYRLILNLISIAFVAYGMNLYSEGGLLAFLFGWL
ncbi:MAG: hypothetical protein FWF83_08595 [Clostridiales bacterium]|nr:hypothetical protein [Clostridiales bacterium]